MQREEIQLRQLWGQHLVQKAPLLTVVKDLCGVQAQFLNHAMHALSIRSEEIQTDELCKSWTLRGTMHVFARDDLALMLHKDRTPFLRPCDTLQDDETMTGERKRVLADVIIGAIAQGTTEREALKECCFAHGMTQQECHTMFNAWGGVIRALCEEGRICHRVQSGKGFELCPPFEPMEAQTARLEMARRYFTHYGPATLRDAAYFFGITQRQVRQWLDRLDADSCTCEGRTYYFLSSKVPADIEMPSCLFLAGFDPLMLGYEKKESLYLPEQHLRGIFNLAGIVMPAVLINGRVCGKWKKTGHKITVTLFETVDAHAQKQMRQTAAQLWPDAQLVLL